MATRKTEKRKPADYLKLPYAQVVVPMEDGTFHAEMPEFPGCLATGETREQALATLQDVAESWLQSMIERGQPIPEPPLQVNYSGKFVVRMPKTLHRRVALAAQRDGVSLNQYVVSCVAAHVGSSARNFASLLSGVRVQTQSTINFDCRHNLLTDHARFVQLSPVESEDA